MGGRGAEEREAVRFDLETPTATEGMMCAVPHATTDGAVELAVAAEELGFDWIGAMTT